MSGYSNAVKNYIELYKQEVGGSGLIDPHVLAGWAYKKGLHKPNAKTIIDVIAADIAQVFREEYRFDENGRRYRAKHAALTKMGNKSLSLWGDIDDPNAPHDHFVRSFGQRRQQIVGDCFQLKTDADVYNDVRKPGDPIQIILDFTLDVEEQQQALNSKAA
jgi:hypothetical protein